MHIRISTSKSISKRIAYHLPFHHQPSLSVRVYRGRQTLKFYVSPTTSSTPLIATPLIATPLAVLYCTT